IASDSAQVAVPVDGGNRYQIVVTTADRGGSYQLSTSFQPADDETCRPRQALAASAGDNGVINGDSCSGDRVWFNFYTVTVSAAGRPAGGIESRRRTHGGALAFELPRPPGPGGSLHRHPARRGHARAEPERDGLSTHPHDSRQPRQPDPQRAG